MTTLIDEPGEGQHPLVRRIGLFGGPLAAALMYFLLPHGGEDGLTDGGRAAAAAAALMAVWWMTEALPLEITGLVPLALFPLAGVATMKSAAAPYADDIIYLFLGGMMLGQAMEVWGLHRRFALATIALVGSKPSRLIGGFLLATAFISMWVSNTAATVMMLPIGASVAAMVASKMHAGEARARQHFAAALVLAIAYGATIGGLGTLIGTPPMSQLASFMNERARLAAAEGGRAYVPAVTFAGWLRIGLPVIGVMAPLAWLVLTRIAFRLNLPEVHGVAQTIRAERAALGPMSMGQAGTISLFVLAALGWMLGSLTHLPDGTVAIGAAILLFVIPAKGAGGEERTLLTWREAQRIPWGILLMFGGGLSLAEAIKANGVDKFIAQHAHGLGGLPLPLVLFVMSLTAVALTEFASNTALVALALPIAAALAEPLHVPAPVLLVTVTLSASLGFMLPAGTPPNALVFASGRVTMRQMMRAGVWMDLLSAAAVPLLVMAAMKLGVLPG